MRGAPMRPKNAVNIHLFQRLDGCAPNLRLHRNLTCHLMAASWVSGALRGARRRMWRKLHAVKLTSERLGQRRSRAKDAGKKGKTAMAAERAQNLQDTFLNHVRKAKIPLTIFLVNGVKLQGVVTWFDNFCVLLRRDGHSQLVYKHAISTIMPGHPVQLFEGGEEPPAVEKV
jgi:host factor-I protein